MSDNTNSDQGEVQDNEQQDVNFEPDAHGSDIDISDEEDPDDDDLSSWPNAKTAILIEMYKARPYMYDILHKHYRNRGKKNAAINKMAAKVNMTREYFNWE